MGAIEVSWDFSPLEKFVVISRWDKTPTQNGDCMRFSPTQHGEFVRLMKVDENYHKCDL